MLVRTGRVGFLGFVGWWMAGLGKCDFWDLWDGGGRDWDGGIYGMVMG
jgi:hypothetical protein